MSAQALRLVRTLAVIVVPALAAHAQVWDGGGPNNDWTTANNWNPNVVPANDGTANVGFRGSTRLTPTINAAVNVRSITFVSPASSFDITNGTFHNFLTVGTGGITNSDDSVQTISCPMRLSAAQTWSATNGNLAINAADGQGFALTVSGAFHTTLDRLTGAGTSLAKNGAGTMFLTGLSTYSGGTTLNAGTLSIDDDARLGSAAGALVINGGMLDYTSTSFATSRDITLTAAGATIDAASAQFSQSGGTLTINGGGVTNGTSFIGLNTTESAAAVVDGSGSNWSAGSSFAVGYQGSGTLTVSGGASLTSGIAHIGSVAGATGAATVTGAGSAWTSSGFLGVGYSGAGTLTIENGGGVSSDSSFVAADPGSIGTVNVTGSGSTWSVTGGPVIGEHGAGTLNISAGGAVADSGAFLGRFADGHGVANVSGAGSLWTNNGQFTVAGDGVGTLTISSGGRVASTDYCQIGSNPSASGDVIVTGVGSTFATTDLYVGWIGVGTLDILAGGQVTDANGSIGNATSSAGSAVKVSGAGSSWAHTLELSVGDGGPGSLRIEAGGNVSNASGRIGVLNSGNGNAVVTDAGSLWTNSSFLTVGYLGGTGSLSILNGAGVTSGQASIGNSNGSGAALVDGSGSTWTVGGTLGLGFNGTGTLQIANGASVSCLQASLGFGVGSTTTTTITGAASHLNCGLIGISMSDSGASSTLNLLGGIASIDGNITDGGAGISTLTLDGATLDMLNHSIGGASPIDNLNFRSGTLRNVAQINNGVGLTKAGPSVLYLDTPNSYSGPTTINQGTLFVMNTSASATGTGTVSVVSGATLAGQGRISGAVQNGGFVAPAGFVGNSTATLTLANTYAQTAGGSLDIRIGGTAQHDRLAVGGVASLAGTLNVALINGFAPSAGDTFTVLTAATVNGAFSTASLPALSAALGWLVEYLPGGVRLRVVLNSSCPGDVNGDRTVDSSDLGTLLANWLASVTPNTGGDLDGNGTVDSSDLGILLANWLVTCP
ncbi:MAG: autotransporter-associated beta strand repeat-containing protein [Phycisphaerae bacterium]